MTKIEEALLMMAMQAKEGPRAQEAFVKALYWLHEHTPEQLEKHLLTMLTQDLIVGFTDRAQPEWSLPYIGPMPEGGWGYAPGAKHTAPRIEPKPICGENADDLYVFDFHEAARAFLDNETGAAIYEASKTWLTPLHATFLVELMIWLDILPDEPFEPSDMMPPFVFL
ncbi:hypothetical protein [Magnetospirillum sp. 15-1]|uniref:hypothetical protein n=1 Tax=Magnetospirillum sp. 15-1 TaxID=1979370 RepID=UPI000BBC6C9C|nr:hypothetical protein [Magnetospirillum sp. 15-1]